MKNSTQPTPDQEDIFMNENEVFEILAEEVRSSYSQNLTAPVAPALKSLFKTNLNLPQFAADKAATNVEQQKLMQSLIFLEEENKFLKMNNNQLLESVNKFQMDSEQKTADFKARLHQAEADTQESSLQLKEFTSNNTHLLEESRKFKFTITDLNAKLVRAEEKEKHISDKLEAADRNFRVQAEERTKQAMAQEKQINSLQYELLDKSRMINDLNCQINEMQISIKQTNQQLTTLTSAADSAHLKAFEYTQKDQLIEHLNGEISLMQNQLQDSQTKFVAMTERAQFATAQASEYLQTCAKLTEMTNQNGELKAQLQDTQLKLKATKAQFDSAEKRSQNLEIEVAQINESTASFQSALLAQNERLQIENTELGRGNESRLATLNKLNDEVQTLQAQLNREQSETKRLNLELTTQNQDQRQISDTYQLRLRKLNSYFVEIEQTKIKFQTNLAKLSAEIQEAVRLHPLKDYYNLTCKEVIRVEIELKKTPTSSPNRKSLEKAMEQLINQREYLKGTISQYEVSLAQKQASVDRMWPQLNVFDTSKT